MEVPTWLNYILNVLQNGKSFGAIPQTKLDSLLSQVTSSKWVVTAYKMVKHVLACTVAWSKIMCYIKQLKLCENIIHFVLFYIL